MARIPDGSQFGQVVAQGGPMANVDAGAFGAGVAEAVTRAGNTGMQMAGNALAQDAAQARQAQAQADAEAKQLAREQAREASAAAKEAARVKTLTATATVQGGLANLHDTLQADLESGKIDKADVGNAWTERSRKLVDDSLANVDPEHKDLVNATLLNDVNRYGQAVSKMVVQRDKKDIFSGGMSYFETMQRYAARGPKEADEAIANVSKFWTATGPMAGEDPAAAAARVQKFTENVRFRQASDLVNVDPAAALKALKNKDYLPELDPDRRAGLVANADAAVLRNQQRGAINAEKAAREQEKAWGAAMTVFEAGKMPSAEYTDTLVRTFKGTPYAAALKTMLQESPANSAFVAQPLAQQAQTMDALQTRMNTQGATPADLATYKKLETAHKAAQADIKADPYMAAAERGVLPSLTPLNMNLAELPAQLAKRGEDARTVSTWAGQEVSLFRPAEAEKVATILQAMPPKDRAGALAGLTKAMTPGQMVELGKQFGSKDATLAAAAMMSANGFKTSSGRLVSEIVLAGSDALKESRVKFPEGKSQTTVRAAIDTATRGAYLSEDAQRAAGDAAMAVYAGLLAEGQTPRVEQAVNLATGGVMDINGAKFVKPFGWQDSQVLKALRDVDAQKVTELAGGKSLVIGGKPVQPEDLAKYLPGAQLGPSSKNGYYTVSIGGRFISGEDGRLFLLPLAGVAK
jgi:hypothetical protein